MTEPMGTESLPGTGTPDTPIGWCSAVLWPSATRRARLTVIGACIVLTLAIATGAAWEARSLYRDAIAGAERGVATESLLLSEEAARALQAADLILRTTAEFLRVAPPRLLADGPRIEVMLRSHIADAPQVQGHTVFGADGFPRFSSRPDVPHVSFMDRPFFSAQQRSSSLGLYISEPMPNRANGSLAIYLSRRVDAADGRFAGVVSLAIEPAYFEHLFQGLTPRHATQVRLMRADGQALITVGPAPGKGGSPAAPRIGSVHAVPGYPLRIEVDLAEASALANWRGTALALALGAAGVIAAVLLLSLMLCRQLRNVDIGHQRIRVAESLFRTVFDTTPLGLQIKDLEGRQRMVNPALVRTVGGTAAELLGKPSHELSPLLELPPESRQRILETDAQVRTAGRPVEFEIDCLVKSAKRRLRIIKVPLRDPEGTITCFLSVIEDVTTRLQTRQRLEQSQSLLHTVINALPQTVTVKDREGRYTLVNEAWTRVHQRDAQWLLGRTAQDVPYHPTEELRWIQELDRAVLETGKQHMLPEVQVALSESAKGWTRVFKAPLRDEAGAVTGILTVTEDIGSLKQAEAQRLELERRILQGQKLESLGVLAGGIAHDFNNLLAGIMGNAELLLAGLPADHPLRVHAEKITRASEVATDLTRQMLTFSGKGRHEERPVNLNAVLQEMGSLLQVAIPRQIETRYRLAPDLPAVLGDPSQLNQIAMNLITNAAEAIGSKPGSITIRTGAVSAEESLKEGAPLPEPRAAENCVFLEVADTGAGMTEEVQRRVFEPFFTTKPTGRGLGMAAVQGIIRRHNGSISIRSAPGQGTVMRVLLPRADDAHARLASPAAGRPRQGGESVLVVDDDPLVRTVLAAQLERMGFHVLTAAGGLESLDALRAHRASIVAVLLDLNMPGMSGEETFRGLKAIRDDVPIIVCSGYSEEIAIGSLPIDAVTGFLQKPIRTDILRRKLEELVSRAAYPADGAMDLKQRASTKVAGV